MFAGQSALSDARVLRSLNRRMYIRDSGRLRGTRCPTLTRIFCLENRQIDDPATPTVEMLGDVLMNAKSGDRTITDVSRPAEIVGSTIVSDTTSSLFISAEAPSPLGVRVVGARRQMSNENPDARYSKRSAHNRA